MKIKYLSGKTVFFFFFTNITLRKNKYVQNLPQLFTNQSHSSTKMTLHPHPCTIYLQQPYWDVPQSTTNKAYLFPPPVTNWTCQHLPPFSPTQKCYFPFIQTIYSVALANLHTFVMVPPTHTENSFTKQHPHLIKYGDMNQESVSLNPCH